MYARSQAPLGPTPLASASVATLRAASLCQMLAWLGLLAVCARFWPHSQGGAFWGGLLMAGNYLAMRWAAERLGRVGLAPDGRGAALGQQAALVLGGKFAAMLAATAAVVHWADPDPLGLFAGFATLLAGMLGAAAYAFVARERI